MNRRPYRRRKWGLIRGPRRPLKTKALICNGKTQSDGADETHRTAVSGRCTALQIG